MDLKLEHSLMQGDSVSKLAHTISAAPTKTDEQALSSNPALLEIVLSQRWREGQVVQLSPEPQVNLPGIGNFTFSRRAKCAKKLKKGSKVRFKLSQAHPPQAISLRAIGEAHSDQSDGSTSKLDVEEKGSELTALSLTTPNGQYGSPESTDKLAPVERRSSAPHKLTDKV